jgi:hypothetical protein
VTVSEMGYPPRSMLVLGIETSCDHD